MSSPSVQVSRSVVDVSDVNAGGWTNVGAPLVVEYGQETKQIREADEKLLSVAKAPGSTVASGAMMASGAMGASTGPVDPTIVVSRPSLACLRMPLGLCFTVNRQALTVECMHACVNNASCAMPSSLRCQSSNNTTTDTHTSMPRALFPGHHLRV